jgi:hypothetical protein
MAKPKQYRIIDPVGVVGFKGVIHKNGDVISDKDVPAANLTAWKRFGQVELVEDKQAVAGSTEQEAQEKTAADSSQNSEAKKKGDKK